ncbi:phosphatidylglycerophosphatase C [Luteibacter sp. OK325]|nr:phosphatidylglycerophosphatase C [Luteibacter sp. OK325]
MRGLLLASPLKLIAALPVLPVALVMLHMPSARRMGASMLLWIAAFGLDHVALEQSIDAFAVRFEQGMRSLRWFDDGMATLRQHIAQGDRVVIVTAAPQWLAERLLVSFAGDLQVIGSDLRSAGGGWILQRHCRGGEKCLMLAEAGYGQAWRWAYSDSADDAPMLACAQEAFLVNASAKVQRRAAARGASRAVMVCWR